MSVQCTAQTILDTDTGQWVLRVYKDSVHEKTHIAMIKGDISAEPVLVRVHSSCITGDILHSKHCDCGQQKDQAMKQIADMGSGVFIYLFQEGRGIGIENKVKAYALQREGMDTYEANHRLGFPDDIRSYEVGIEIVKDCGINNIRLLTNNPKKIKAFSTNDITVVERVPLVIPANGVDNNYLAAKKAHGHLL